jgi:hypothetical protein
VNEADLDWLVYHLIQQDPGGTEAALALSAGCGHEEIRSSLERLKRYLLIENHESGYRALSQHEMIVKCQCTYDQHLPYTIEGGVVRVKKREGQ